MGIDDWAIKVLDEAFLKGPLKKTLTLGRQRLIDSDGGSDGYCEELFLNKYGSTSVDSIDISNYEGATIIHDLNFPVNESLHHKFDTVFDGGCLEHIFNISQALYNVSKMCKVGGQIIHILPANDFCGHGFWQFSPELFFSLYSEKNGYGETNISIGDMTNVNFGCSLESPKNGIRQNIKHPNPIYVIVRTVLMTENFSHAIQQSDYYSVWSDVSSAQIL